jgi:hypothetical protein
MLSYQFDCPATCYSLSFTPMWRPTGVRLNDKRRETTPDLEQLIRTVLGFSLAFVAACCYMKFIPSASIVVAAALSAKIVSAVTGQMRP